MKIAWQQCGLAEPWNLAFQLQARDMMDAGTLFPISAAAVPGGLEAEPTDKGDQVDDEHKGLCSTQEQRQASRSQEPPQADRHS